MSLKQDVAIPTHIKTTLNKIIIYSLIAHVFNYLKFYINKGKYINK